MKFSMSCLRALALITAGAVPLQAQSRVTLLAGYATSRVVADPGGEQPISPVHAFAPGVGFTFRLSDRVGLTAEALYVPKGYSYFTPNPYTSLPAYTYKLDAHYVEFPWLLTARYPFGKAQMVILGGATLGVRVHCVATETTPDSSQLSNNCTLLGTGGTVPAINVALTAGFGFAWHRWTLTGQYEVTGSSSFQPFPPGPALQHRTLILMLGFDVIEAIEHDVKP